MGYRDINKYVFIYEQFELESENIINNYVLYLLEYSCLFFYDWKLFQFDDMLCWSVSDIFEFIFFNVDMDIYRESIVKFFLFGLKYRDFIIRFWFMMIFELSGKEFFFYVGDVVLQVERKYNIFFLYLCGCYVIEDECEVYNNMYKYFIVKEINLE